MVDNILRIIFIIIIIASVAYVGEVLIDIIFDAIEEFKKSYNEMENHTE